MFARAHRASSARSRIVSRLVLLAALVVSPLASAENGPIDEAWRLFDAGNYQQAAAALRAVLEAKAKEATPGGAPAAKEAEIHYRLARCYFELHDFDRAIASAERAVELDSGNSLYHLWLGRAFGRKAEQAGWFSGFGLARKTRHEFEQAVRLNPANFPAQHDLIEFYVRAPGIVGGGEDKAERQVEAVAAVDPIEGHVVRGWFWMERKKSELAEQEFRQALEAKPQRVDPYFEAADFYLKRKNAEGMEAVVEAAARVDASDRRLSYYRGVARVLAGNRPAEAEQWLKTYLATVPRRSDLPSHAEAHEWLGRLYENQRKCPEASAEYHKALELNPHNKTVQAAVKRMQKCQPGK